VTDDRPARPGRALGVDLGARRIGIAVSDSAGTLATPRGTVTRSGDAARDRRARVDLGLPAEGPLVVSVSRLVPRKGMDVLIDAAATLSARYPDLTVAIAGRGRDAERLAGRVAELGAPVRLLGGVSDADLPRLVGAADVFAMLCRNRWLGLEQEGFGIVFLEAAAAGVPGPGYLNPALYAIGKNAGFIGIFNDIAINFSLSVQKADGIAENIFKIAVTDINVAVSVHY